MEGGARVHVVSIVSAPLREWIPQGMATRWRQLPSARHSSTSPTRPTPCVQHQPNAQRPNAPARPLPPSRARGGSGR
eukprot:3766114-Prymnesium_polylepis.1